MPNYAVLISDRTHAAYFGDRDSVVLAEAAGIPGVRDLSLVPVGQMQFLRLTAEPRTLVDIVRLSSAQGVFEINGDGYVPVDIDAEFALHSDFVWGEKYRGKTNETLTQLLINLVLQAQPDASPNTLRILDPMCGRGTSLFWALRYGMSAVGLEQDGSVLNEIKRGLKKWTKLHRQKHSLSDGWIQKANKQGVGQFLEFKTGPTAARIVIGDSADAFELTQRKTFDGIVCDIPYGVQHMGSKSGRNPLETIQACAPAWANCLKPGGAMAIAFNRNIPKRAQMETAFAGLGLDVVAKDMAHRMSESIVRDVLILQRPK